MVYVRTPWETGGKTFATGTVIATGLEGFLAGGRDFSVIVEPGPRATVQRTVAGADYLLVSILDNVQGQLWKYRLVGSRWHGERVDVPGMGNVGIVDVDRHSNRFFFRYSSFTQPTTLYLHDDDGSVRLVRQAPARFDAEGIGIVQLEATSADGIKVPYFVTGRHPPEVLAGVHVNRGDP